MSLKGDESGKPTIDERYVETVVNLTICTERDAHQNWAKVPHPEIDNALQLIRDLVAELNAEREDHSKTCDSAEKAAAHIELQTKAIHAANVGLAEQERQIADYQHLLGECCEADKAKQLFEAREQIADLTARLDTANGFIGEFTNTPSGAIIAGLQAALASLSEGSRLALANMEAVCEGHCKELEQLQAELKAAREALRTVLSYPSLAIQPEWDGNDGGVLIDCQVSRRTLAKLRAALKESHDKR